MSRRGVFCRGIRASRANKPKALSAPLTAELGAKTRGEGRAVLLNKTPPCLNKSGLFLSRDDQVWIPLRKFEAKGLFLTQVRSKAFHSESDRITVEQRDSKRGMTSHFATLCDRKRRGGWRVARATFWGAKPITELGGSARCDDHSSGREGD